MSKIQHWVTPVPGLPGKWRARYIHPVTGKEVNRRANSEAEGWDIIQRAITQITTGDWVAPKKGRMTLAEFWDTHYSVTNAKEWEPYNYHNYLLPVFGKMALEDIDKALLRRWSAGLKTTRLVKQPDKVMSAATASSVYALMHKLMKIAAEDDFIARTPFTASIAEAKPKIPTPRKLTPLSPQQIELLAATIRDRAADRPGRYHRVCVVEDWALMHYTLIYAMAYGGFRIGEVLGLRIDDLNREALSIDVDEQLHSTRGLTNDLKRRRSTRTVMIPAELMEIIVHHVDVNVGWINPRALLFTNKVGKPMDTGGYRARWFRPVVAELGLVTVGTDEGAEPDYVTPHFLRHTAASAWADEGFTIDDVAEFLGDDAETVRTTYVHIFQKTRDAKHANMGQRIREGRANVARPHLRAVN